MRSILGAPYFRPCTLSKLRIIQPTKVREDNCRSSCVNFSNCSKCFARTVANILNFITIYGGWLFLLNLLSIDFFLLLLLQLLAKLLRLHQITLELFFLVGNNFGSDRISWIDARRHFSFRISRMFGKIDCWKIFVAIKVSFFIDYCGLFCLL